MSSKSRIPLKPLNKNNARILFAGLFCLILGATGSLVTINARQDEVTIAVNQAQIAAENAKSQAQIIRDTLCYDTVDQKTAICEQAKEVIRDPNSLAPIKGDQGIPGTGIVSSVINLKNELVVSYTNGTSQNLGVVVGKDGIHGSNGIDGVSIASQSINPDGRLIVTYSDGRAVDLGLVVGARGIQGIPGPQGPAGKDGTMISAITATCSATNTLVIHIESNPATPDTTSNVACTQVP